MNDSSLVSVISMPGKELYALNLMNRIPIIETKEVITQFPLNKENLVH